jgi:hypothetical protein
MPVERTDKEIDEQVNRACNIGDQKGTLFRGMTYEAGVRDALQWVTGQETTKPLSDEETQEYD